MVEKAGKSLKMNFVMNAILTMSSFVFPLITFPYVSRILLPIGMGKVSFATSLISYFSLFAQLGIPTYGIRACAVVRGDREKLTRTAHELLLINLIMTVISYGGLTLALLFVPRLREERILYIIVSSNILFTSIGMEWIYKALEQYAYITVRSILSKLAALCAMFLLIHRQSDYVVYGGITIFAASASNILNFVNVHRYIDRKPIGGYCLSRHIKPVSVFFAMSCAATVYTHLDTVMLGFMASDADVGYYNAAVKIKTVLVSIVTSLGTVLLPRVSCYVRQGLMKDFRRITRKAVNFVVLLASPLSLYFIFFAEEGIHFLSGSGYADSVVPMQIIMPTLLLIGITNIFGMQILVPMGKENIVLYSEIAGAIVDIIINIVLIPRLASVGAAWGTLAAEFVVLLVQCYALGNEAAGAFKQIHFFRIVIALVLGSAASLGVKTMEFGSFLTLLISAVLFFGIYGLFLLLTREPLVLGIFNQVIDRIKEKTCKCLKK